MRIVTWNTLSSSKVGRFVWGTSWFFLNERFLPALERRPPQVERFVRVRAAWVGCGRIEFFGMVMLPVWCAAVGSGVCSMFLYRREWIGDFKQILVKP
jgi:hypothetical protein